MKIHYLLFMIWIFVVAAWLWSTFSKWNARDGDGK